MEADLQKSVLVCAACGSTLSNPVQLIQVADFNAPEVCMDDEADIVSKGRAFLSAAPWARRIPEGPVHNGHVPQYWMNLDDLLEIVGLTDVPKFLVGCCGLDGCDGPNRICSCGAPVGTEKSDCWQPRMFIPLPEATDWKSLPPNLETRPC